MGNHSIAIAVKEGTIAHVVWYDKIALHPHDHILHIRHIGGVQRNAYRVVVEGYGERRLSCYFFKGKPSGIRFNDKRIAFTYDDRKHLAHFKFSFINKRQGMLEISYF